MGGSQYPDIEQINAHFYLGLLSNQSQAWQARWGQMAKGSTFWANNNSDITTGRAKNRGCSHWKGESSVWAKLCSHPWDTLGLSLWSWIPMSHHQHLCAQVHLWAERESTSLVNIQWEWWLLDCETWVAVSKQLCGYGPVLLKLQMDLHYHIGT